MEPTEKAKAWIFRQSGNAFDLTCVDREQPAEAELGEYEVLVRVRAVSLNYRDIVGWRNLAGRKLDGRVPTSDGAGEVVAVGQSVSQWKVGDRVCACFFPKWQSGKFDLVHHKNDLGGTLDGMLRTWVTMNEDGLVRVPAHMSWEEAATLPCAGLTAWQALVPRGELKQGETVLVLGTGGVSIFSLQIAVAHGATVIITSSSDEKLARARSMGAAHTINYRSNPDWASEVWKITHEQGADHIVEVGGPGTLEQSMKAVAAGGQIALIGILTGFGAPSASLFPLMARNVRLDGMYVGPKDQFVKLNHFLEDNRIVPIVDKIFEFDQAPEAFAYLESGQHFGKVVIRV